MNEKPDNFFAVSVAPLRRLLPFAPRLGGVLYQPAAFHHGVTTHRGIDFGLELSSTEEFAEFEIDDAVYRRRFPWISTRMPGRRYRMRTAAPWEVLAFSFAAANDRGLRDMGLNPESPGWEFTLTPQIEELLRKIFALCRNHQQPGAADELDLTAVALLRQTRLGVPTGWEAEIRAIAAELATQVTHPIELDRVTERHGLSRPTFFRRWKQLYGDESPWQFAQRHKLDAAARLLRSTDRRIGEIATDLGFSETTYFCRCFHREFGVSPASYRAGRAGDSP